MRRQGAGATEIIFELSWSHIVYALGINAQRDITLVRRPIERRIAVDPRAPPRYIAYPLEPTAGTWRPWVVRDVAVLRPPPPPAWDSPMWRAQLDAVRNATATRTPEQAKAALFWAGNDGTFRQLAVPVGNSNSNILMV